MAVVLSPMSILSIFFEVGCTGVAPENEEGEALLISILSKMNRDFTAISLFLLERQYARRGPSWGIGWAVDKWDAGRDHVQDIYG